MQGKSVRLCLSTTVEVTFILPKLYLKKLVKKLLNFLNSIFCSMWKTEQRFIIFFFTYHSQKYFTKAFFGLLCIIKVPCRNVLLSIIICCHLLLTYHTQKYFIKECYYIFFFKLLFGCPMANFRPFSRRQPH